MGMDCGLIYELVVPKPHTPGKEAAIVRDLIEQVKLADKLGFSHVWHVEHHFLNEFSHSSAPDAILGAYAAVTEQIRIGFGVKLLPFGFNHPVRTAEQVATLDLVSNGRVDFGTGRGLSRIEMEGFSVDPKKTRDEWREALEIIVKCWEDEPFSWQSPSLQFPPRDVVPKPAQRPHPPIWMAAASPDTHTVAGEAGLGLLSFAFMTPMDELHRRMELYKDGLKRAAPLGKFVNAKAGGSFLVHCADTDEEARASAGRAIEWYVKSGLEIYGSLAAWIEGKGSSTHDYLKEMMSVDLSQVTFESMDALDMCVVGNPDTCIKKLERYRDAGFEQVIGIFQLHGVSHERVKRSIELFGTHVIPALQ